MSGVRSSPQGARLLGGLLAVAGVALLVIGVLALTGEDSAPPEGAPGPTTSAEPTGPPTGATSPAPLTTTPTVTTSPPTTTPTTTTPPAIPPPVPRAPLTVLNNSTVPGLADRAAAEAQRRGWQVAQVGNFAGRLPVTTVYYTPGNPAEERAARQFATEFPQVERVFPRYAGLPPTPAGIVVVVTRDWT